MNAAPSSERRAILNRIESHCLAGIGDRWGPFGKRGPFGMRRPPQAGLYFSWRGSAGRPWWTVRGRLGLPSRRGLPGAGHDDDDLPKPEACGVVSALSTGTLPPRPDILYPTRSPSLRPMSH